MWRLMEHQKVKKQPNLLQLILISFMLGIVIYKSVFWESTQEFGNY